MVDSALSNRLDEDDFPVHFPEEIPSRVVPLEFARTFDFGLSLGKI
jgi:hypothetical protein